MPVRLRIPTPTWPMIPTVPDEAGRDGPPPVSPSPPAAAARSLDPVLVAAIAALLSLGVVMVYSASAVFAARRFGAADYFLRRELLWATLGLAAFATAASTDYGALRRYVYPLLGLSIALLVLVLFVGARINGARRWLHLGGISVQPGELARLAVVAWLSLSLAKKAEKVRSFTVGFLPHMAIAGAVMGLLLKQPDLGTAVIIGFATLLLLLVAGARISYLLLAVLAAAPIVYQAVVGTPWRMRRIVAWLDPWEHRFGAGYQVAESLISIGSGGPTGLGLGDGRQKLLFLPEAHTDYIMAIVGEELGFVGIAAVVPLVVVFLWRGVRAALRARDAFGCYLAFGITALVTLQALVNLGVVLGSIPTKGLPMPFISYGGSALVVDLFAAGVLLDISRGAPEPVRTTRPGRAAVLLRWLAAPRGNRRRAARLRLAPDGAVSVGGTRERGAEIPLLGGEGPLPLEGAAAADRLP